MEESHSGLVARARERVADLSAQWRDPARRARRRGDFFGGAVAALIAVPYGMALAVAIGLRPEAGLYTSIIGGAISGLISEAPVVVSGLSATVVPVLAGLVKNHGVGAALAAGALCGAIMILLGAFRLGRFFHHLPPPVVGAFTSGLGVIIVASQLKVVLSVRPNQSSFDLGVIDDLWETLRLAGQADPQTLAIGAIIVGAMILLRHRTLPAPLIGVTLATIVAGVCGWDLMRVGALPDQFLFPDPSALDFSAFGSLITPALTLAGLITINQLLTVVVTDRLGEKRGEMKLNRELIAQGAANVVCPMFGAPPGVAMLARTVASARAGAVSRWSVLAHSLILLVFLLPLRDLISRVPLAALGAVTVAVGIELVGIERFRALARMPRADALLFVVTFALVVLSDLIVGVGAGALLTALVAASRNIRRATPVRAMIPGDAGTVVALNHPSNPGGKR